MVVVCGVCTSHICIDIRTQMCIQRVWNLSVHTPNGDGILGVFLLFL